MSASAQSLDQPSDTRMMNLVHAALRRDLQRASSVLEDPERVSAGRLRALGRHLVWFVEFLHVHHTVEDEHLFPVVAARRPDLSTMLELMDDEHHQIAPALEQLDAIARSASKGARPGVAVAQALREAVSALSQALTPHLYDEETLMMPAVEQTLSEAEWQAYDRENLDRSKVELAFIGHWLLDGLDDEQDRRKVTGQVPRPVAWVLIHLMGGPYRRRCRATWAGTPAQTIGSTPLPRLAAPDSRVSRAERPSPARNETP